MDANNPEPVPPWEEKYGAILHSFCRLQLPQINLSSKRAMAHLQRTYQLFHKKNPAINGWDAYFKDLYPLDWFLACSCLEGIDEAWDYLFATRAGKSDFLLLDALRLRAIRLFPRNEEKQESAINEFWSFLFIPPKSPEAQPILACYDGLRPLVPWIIRVFQNFQISEIRKGHSLQMISDENWIPARTDPEPVWHDVFCDAARQWLAQLGEKELLILGLRMRYKISQREVAQIMGTHEGTISRRIDSLKEDWKKNIQAAMGRSGWTGEDLSEYIRTEMGNILLDSDHLTADNLARLMVAQNIAIPSSFAQEP